jgi:hypothetical protein
MSSLDILFLIDATGSMTKVIDGVKRKIQDLVNSIHNSSENTKIIRLSIVAYRDYDDEPRYETLNFTENIDEFKNFLENLKAKGGDDQAEDVFTGLQQVNLMNWNSEARILIHFADAPCHGSIFHEPYISDNYPEGDKENRNIYVLLRNLVDYCNINTYQFMHINQSTQLMFDQFRDIYRSDDLYVEEYMRNLEDMNDQLYSGSMRSIMMSQSQQINTPQQFKEHKAFISSSF